MGYGDLTNPGTPGDVITALLYPGVNISRTIWKTNDFPGNDLQLVGF